MARGVEESDLFQDQLDRLGEGHFLILCWCSLLEAKSIKYNITNCFDDSKQAGITRTKQTAVAFVETLWALCYIDIREERNRKNIYITEHGGKALERLIKSGRFVAKESSLSEGIVS
ncbi:MAG: hypothetical protein J6X49_08700 [Victivallales bacterium]|nr:hypothetical protein [Victivallales bacterium]